PLAGFAATGDVTPLIVNPVIMPFNLGMSAFHEFEFSCRRELLGRRCFIVWNTERRAPKLDTWYVVLLT
ncbi:MAG TPA: hypothetical protein PLY87_04560, partial [Planctomycetaceae bacterium]|nr:hypothetical protein [Planctomycetaceae bacterium]HQZ64321.1 hypothetical protein [Planctomycetaceae bacterium]